MQLYIFICSRNYNKYTVIKQHNNYKAQFLKEKQEIHKSSHIVKKH